MRIVVVSKQKKEDHSIEIDEEDGRELERVLAGGGEVFYKKARVPFMVLKRPGNSNQVLARWVAGRARGRDLTWEEKVKLKNGNPHDLRRENIEVSVPKGVKKGDEVAWIVKSNGINYLCIRSASGARVYLPTKDKDPEEARREWAAQP